MSETLERPATQTPAAAPQSKASAQAQDWLAAFEAALAAKDSARAAALFAQESFWRDLR